MRSTILFTGLVMTTAICAEDWPEFRGPTGQGIATATNVPVHWSGASNVVWKTRIPGSGWSSPVLADGRLYVTTGVTSSSAAGTSLRAICVDAADGKIIWDVEALTADAAPPKNSIKRTVWPARRPLCAMADCMVTLATWALPRST